MIRNRFNWLHYHKHWLIEPLHHQNFIELGVEQVPGKRPKMMVRMFGIEFLLDGRGIEPNVSAAAAWKDTSFRARDVWTVVQLYAKQRDYDIPLIGYLMRLYNR